MNKKQRNVLSSVSRISFQILGVKGLKRLGHTVLGTDHFSGKLSGRGKGGEFTRCIPCEFR